MPDDLTPAQRTSRIAAAFELYLETLPSTAAQLYLTTEQIAERESRATDIREQLAELLEGSTDA